MNPFLKLARRFLRVADQRESEREILPTTFAALESASGLTNREGIGLTNPDANESSSEGPPEIVNEPPSASRVVALRSLHEFITGKVVEAHAANAEGMRLRAAGLDSSLADFLLAEILSAIRQGIADAIAILELQSGESWTRGIRAAHFGREIRNAQQALAVADLQSSRLDFVVGRLVNQSAGAVTEAGGARGVRGNAPLPFLLPASFVSCSR
ncbi:MAG: hypothetical protein ACR2NX_14560 [Chthoniobacterales bacterium]